MDRTAHVYTPKSIQHSNSAHSYKIKRCRVPFVYTLALGLRNCLVIDQCARRYRWSTYLFRTSWPVLRVHIRKAQYGNIHRSFVTIAQRMEPVLRLRNCCVEPRGCDRDYTDCVNWRRMDSRIPQKGRWRLSMPKAPLLAIGKIQSLIFWTKLY